MDEKSSCSLQLFFFFDTAAMEDVLVALTMLLLLRVARVVLPPLVGAWRQKSQWKRWMRCMKQPHFLFVPGTYLPIFLLAKKSCDRNGSQVP